MVLNTHGEIFSKYSRGKVPLCLVIFVLKDLVPLFIECTQKNNLRNGVSFYSTDHLNYIFCRALFLSVDYPRLVTESTWKACKVVIQELDNKEETDATVSGDSCEKPSVFLTLLCNPVSTLGFFTG